MAAALREILIDNRSAKCCIFPYKMRLQDGTSKVSEAVRDDDFMVGLSSDRARIMVGLSSNRLYYWRKQFRDFSLKS